MGSVSVPCWCLWAKLVMTVAGSCPCRQPQHGASPRNVFALQMYIVVSWQSHHCDCPSTEPLPVKIRGICLASNAKLDRLQANTSSFFHRTARFSDRYRQTRMYGHTVPSTGGMSVLHTSTYSRIIAFYDCIFPINTS